MKTTKFNMYDKEILREEFTKDEFEKAYSFKKEDMVEFLVAGEIMTEKREEKDYFAFGTNGVKTYAYTSKGLETKKFANVILSQNIFNATLLPLDKIVKTEVKEKVEEKVLEVAEETAKEEVEEIVSETDKPVVAKRAKSRKTTKKD